MDWPQSSQSINNRKEGRKACYHDVWARIQDPLFIIHNAAKNGFLQMQDEGKKKFFRLLNGSKPHNLTLLDVTWRQIWKKKN